LLTFAARAKVCRLAGRDSPVLLLVLNKLTIGGDQLVAFRRLQRLGIKKQSDPKRRSFCTDANGTIPKFADMQISQAMTIRIVSELRSVTSRNDNINLKCGDL